MNSLGQTHQKFIRKVVYKNGQTEVEVPVKVFKFEIGSGYQNGLEFFPVDSCNCSKVLKVKFKPNHSGIYETREILCSDLPETIYINANGQFSSLRTPDWSSSFSGSDGNDPIISFEKDAAADNALLKILTPVGLSGLIDEGRIIIEAAPIENAKAAIIQGKRYIYYNPDIINRINDEDWASIGVFAHELAHHIFFQDIESKSESEEFHQLELEADEWAGYMLGHLNCPEDSVLAMTRFIRSNTGTFTHPSLEGRKEKIMLGWSRGNAAKINLQINKKYIETFAEGKSSFEKGHFPEALAKFDLTIKHNPWFKDAYLYRGIVNIKLKQPALSIPDITRYVRDDSTNVEAYQYRALGYALTNNLDLAEKDIVKAFKIGGSLALSHFAKGIININRLKYLDAIKSLDIAIAMEAQRPAQYYYRATAYYGLSNFTQALSDFNMGISIDKSRDPQAFFSRALAKFALKDFDGAIADYNECLQIDSNNLGAYFNIAYTYQFIGKHQEAVEYYTRVLSRDNSNTNAMYSRAWCKFMLGQYDEIIPELDEVLSIIPNQLDALFLKSKVHQTLKQYDLALPGFDKLVEVNPIEINYLARGNCLLEIFQNARAKDDFAKVLQFNPSNLDALSGLAISKYRLGMNDEALGDFNRLIGMNPIGLNYLNRAICLSALRRYKEALADLIKADELVKDFAQVYYWQAFVKSQLRYKPKALLEDINKAIALEQKNNIINVESLFLRAGFYILSNEKSKACDDLAVIRNQPVHPFITEQSNTRSIEIGCH